MSTSSHSSSMVRCCGQCALLALLGACLLALPNLRSQDVADQTDAAAPTEEGATLQSDAANEYRIQWPDFPLDLVAVEYEQLTGKMAILDDSIIGSTITISTSQTLTKTGAIEFIEKSLLLNGYALVPSGVDSVKLIAYGSAKNPRSEGVPLVRTAEQLPEGDQLVSAMMEFEHISPEAAAATFERVVPLHDYGDLTPVEGTRVLLASENAATLRVLFELKDEIDVPQIDLVSKSFQLERADAELVAESIQVLADAQFASSSPHASSGGSSARRSGSQVPTSTTIRPGAGISQQRATPVVNTRTQRSSSQDIEIGAPRIIPIHRTNRLLVQARPVDMAYIGALIEEFDAPSEVRSYFKRRLNYISVSDFLPIAGDALARGGENLAGATPGAQRSAGQSSSRSSGGSGQSGGISLGEPVETSFPESLVVGKTLLISHPEDNSVVVSGSPEHQQMVSDLIDELDIKPRQIYLSTVIGQLTLGDDLNYGADIIRVVDQFKLDSAATQAAASFFSRGSTGAVVSPLRLSEVEAFPDIGGISLYGQFGRELSGYVSALESTNRFQVLSRPSVITRNNKKAIIASGQQVPVPTSTLTSLDAGVNTPAVSSNISFRDVVLRLEVIPLINSDDEVTLEIAQVNDNIIGSQIIGGNEIPIIGTQELKTTVTVPDRSTVLLGGLISESTSETHTGVPLLIRVPIIKHLFGTTTTSTSRQELLIFIQPHIISGPEDFENVNIDVKRRTEISTDTYEFGIPEMRQPLPADGIERLRGKPVSARPVGELEPSVEVSPSSH